MRRSVRGLLCIGVFVACAYGAGPGVLLLGNAAAAQDTEGSNTAGTSADSGAGDASASSESGGSDGGAADSGPSDAGSSDSGSDGGGSDGGGSDNGGSDGSGSDEGGSDEGGSDGGDTGGSGSDGGDSGSGGSDGGTDSGGSDGGGSDTSDTGSSGSDGGDTESDGSDGGGSDDGGSDSGGSDGVGTAGGDTGGGGSDSGTDGGGTDTSGGSASSGGPSQGGGSGGSSTDDKTGGAAGGGVTGGGSQTGTDGRDTGTAGGEPVDAADRRDEARDAPSQPSGSFDGGSDSGRAEAPARGSQTGAGRAAAADPPPSLPDVLRSLFGRKPVVEDRFEPAAAVVTEVRAVAEPEPEPEPEVAAPAVIEVATPDAGRVVETVRADPPAAETERVVVAPARRIRAGTGGGNGDAQYRQEQITALGLTRESRQVLGALGFRILSERPSALLGGRIVARLRTPSGQSATAALARVRTLMPELVFDLAHLYRPSGETLPVRYARTMIGAPEPGSCRIEARVGLIDTGVASHASLRGADIVRRSFVARNAATNVAHGTAIASLLVGDLPGAGALLPGATLYSANVFAQDAQGLRADAPAIIEALDWMAEAGVKVVNLSLMGPPNALLDRAVTAAAQRGQVLVAAAGNDGPAGAPAYPAAYGPVIAVSAVDARGRAYSANNRGAYVTLAAPGVDIWAADARGGAAFWTGTSFAAPFVTATAARDIAIGRAHDINDGRRLLARNARDLGAPGRDQIFGYGLVQVNGCLGAQPPILSARD